MKWLKIALLVILILLTNSPTYPQSMLINKEYDNSFSQVRIVDKVYSSKNNYLIIDAIIPQISGLANENKQSNINNTITKWTEEWINDVKSIADEYFDKEPAPLNPYQLLARYKVTKLDSLISFYIDYYQFTGGAHGVTTRKAYNIDKETGNILTMTDIFEKGYNYKEKIDYEINKEINKNPNMYFTGKEGFNGIDDKTKFYIEGGNLVIYYGQYEIAPYAGGMPEFRLPINIFEGKFKYDKI